MGANPRPRGLLFNRHSATVVTPEGRPFPEEPHAPASESGKRDAWGANRYEGKVIYNARNNAMNTCTHAQLASTEHSLMNVF